MKRLSTAFFLFFSIISYGQTDNKGKTEIYGGYGIATAQDIITGLSNILAGALLPRMVKRIDVNGGGAIFGGVDYCISNRTTLGLQANYASYDQTYKMSDGSTSTMNTKYATFMLHSRISWVNKPSFQVYSALSGGIAAVSGKTRNDDKKTRTTAAFQISPVGVRVGNNIAFFGEFGMGFQGILSGGLSLRF